MTALNLNKNSVTPVLSIKYAVYIDIFSNKEIRRLLLYKQGDHAIDLNRKDFLYRFLYNLLIYELKELRDYLNDVLTKNWIRYFINPAGVSILFILKKDRGLRLYVDYRGLNKIIIKNRYSLPLISKTLDRFNNFKIFIKLDFKNIYHRIKIKEGDEWKTAFRTRYGYFEYIIIFFGFVNVSAIFQIYINRFFIGYVDIFYVVYFNNILIYL